MNGFNTLRLFGRFHCLFGNLFLFNLIILKPQSHYKQSNLLSAIFHSVKIKSMISTIFEFITRILVWIIKNIFGLISFILRQFFRLLRLFYAIFPVTGIVFSLFYILMAITLFSGDYLLQILPLDIDSSSFRNTIIDIAKNYLTLMSSYSKTLMYFVLLFLLFILVLPMLFILIGFGVISFCTKFLAVGLIADAFLYLFIMILTGKSPTKVFLSRYKVLFPSIGRKLDENHYNSWIRHRRYEKDADEYYDNRSRHRHPEEDFYEEDAEDEYDDGYDDEYEEEFEEYDDEDYDDEDEYIEDDNEDEEYIEDKSYRRDSYSRRRRRRYSHDDFYEDDEPKDSYEEESRSSSYKQAASFTASSGSFNFFAGCTTRESADKKYKSLVKLYHPDNMDGDTAALQEINAQYSAIKRILD